MSLETARPPAAGPGPPVGQAARGPQLPRPAWVAGIGLLLLTLLLVVQVGVRPLSNGDSWFHLRAGREFWGAWSLWHPGQPTRFATEAWVPTQWSTEMLSARMDDWFGLAGVAWMYGALYLAFTLGVYVAGRSLAGPLASATATTLAVFAASTTLSARPQVISLVLMTVTVRAWWGTHRDGRARWWLVPLTWVWATAHGLWSLGVLLGLVAAAGLVLDRRVRGRRAGHVLAVPVLSTLAALATPLGPRLVLSQLAVSRRSPLIAEWGATSFRTFPALVVAMMVAAVVVVWLRTGRVEWTALLTVGMAVGWAMLVTRLVALAAVVVAPLLARALSGGMRIPAPAAPEERERESGSPGMSILRRAEGVVVALAALASLVALAVAVPRTAAEAAGVPTGFSPRLAALPRNSSVLVEDSSGAWMEWRFPGVQPVVDGLLDAYPVPYLEELARFWRAEPGWREFVAATGARVGVMKEGSPATTALREELHWRVLQRDRQWVYLVAPGSAR